jgi:predicted RNase H-like nuclease (RuvC/YqgF family)
MRWLTVEEISELLEHELSDAVEIKDAGSLKRFVRLLAENAVSTTRYEKDQQGIRGDIRSLTAEIHHIAENMQTGFAEMNRRFDETIKQMNRRFDDLLHHMDKRFEQSDKRFDDLLHHMDKRFEQTDKRFEQTDKRFESLDRRFSMMFTFITIGFSAITAVVVLLKFIGVS